MLFVHVRFFLKFLGLGTVSHEDEGMLSVDVG
jgi:hypothetical protein